MFQPRDKRRFLGVLALLASGLLSGCRRDTSSQQTVVPIPHEHSASGAAKESPAAPRDAQPKEIESSDQTLAAQLLVRPSRSAPGAKATLVVLVKLHRGWHIAPFAVPSGPTKPTQLSLKLPKGIQAIGDWKAPEPTTLYDGTGPSSAYVGDLKFSHELAIDSNLSTGPVEISCSLNYQACNESMCLRPNELSLGTTLEIIK
jgi:DsbC/DsbD-like thiol-disulfide interchange protein